jgi:HlyD family secretion protein
VLFRSVKEISSLAVESNPWQAGSTPGRKNFEVTIAVKETDPKTLKPGMTADVEFICDQLAKATYVPIESVIEQDGKTFVYVKEGKHYVRQRVSVGRQNDNFICVTKGLKTGQAITLRDPNLPTDEPDSATKTDSGDAKKDKTAPTPMPEPGKKK